MTFLIVLLLAQSAPTPVKVCDPTANSRCQTVTTQSGKNGSDVNIVGSTGAIGVTQSTSPWVVSGTVTANAGTNLNTSLLCLDATLTGGTQKAIARGGAKGATTAADITSTANGVDHQGLDVQIQNATLAVTQSGAWSLSANQSVNVAQINGVTTQMGTGASGTGTQRVVLSSDSALAANQSTNLAQIAGATTPTGNGTAAGSLRVSIASDTTGVIAATQSGTWTDRVVGNAGGAFDAVNNAAAPANVLAYGAEAATMGTTQPTAATAGNLRRVVAGSDGVLYERFGGPVNWSGFVQGVTVLTQIVAAPAAGLRAYVTSLTCDNQAATVQTIDVVFGTGTNCATGATAISHKFQMGTNATTTSPDHVTAYFFAPLVPTAANAICVRPGQATAFGCTLSGYTAP